MSGAFGLNTSPEDDSDSISTSVDGYLGVSVVVVVGSGCFGSSLGGSVVGSVGCSVGSPDYYTIDSLAFLHNKYPLFGT